MKDDLHIVATLKFTDRVRVSGNLRVVCYHLLGRNLKVNIHNLSPILNGTLSALRFKKAGTTVRPLLSAVIGRTKFRSQKPRINEVCG